MRDTTAPNVESLRSHPKGPGSRLLLVQLESTNPEDYTKLASTIKSEGISHLDVVIPNAGAASPAGSPATVDIQDLTKVFDVNTLSTLRLFQTTRELLEKSPGKPKWASMSTAVASIAYVEQYGTARISPYALSKVGMNWLTVYVDSYGHNRCSFGTMGCCKPD